jgi:hypothetical protein
MYFFPSWDVGQIAGWVLTGGALLGFLYMVSLLCAWAFRARWAGSLVYSIRTLDKASWFYPVLLATNSWNILRNLLRGPRTPDSHFNEVYLAQVRHDDGDWSVFHPVNGASPAPAPCSLPKAM